MSGERSEGKPRLTVEAFESLLAWLDPDRARAGEAYVRQRERVVRYLEWRGCEMSDALADEVFDRVARRLAEGVEVKAEQPGPYIYGVARLVCLEALKLQQKRRAARDAEPPAGLTSDAADAELRDRRLARCLAALDTDQRTFILRYYEHDGQDRIRARQRLAVEMGLPLNALRIRAHRLRERLAECLSRATDATDRRKHLD
ncbi:MAG: hypothetical protein AB1806_19890 [Acidobacteriota bacterium]